MDNATHAPVDEVRIGRIKAAIWANTGADGRIRHNVTLTRLYKTDEGWRHTQSFGRDDLLVIAKVVDQAHSRILTLAAQAGEEQPPADAPAGMDEA